jgi:hypothetical protein
MTGSGVWDIHPSRFLCDRAIDGEDPVSVNFANRASPAIQRGRASGSRRTAPTPQRIQLSRCCSNLNAAVLLRPLKIPVLADIGHLQ